MRGRLELGQARITRQPKVFVGEIIKGTCPKCGDNLAKSISGRNALLCTGCDKHYMLGKIKGIWKLVLVDTEEPLKAIFYDSGPRTNETKTI